MKKITLILKSAFVLSLAISFGMLQDLQAATLYYHKFEGAVASPASATYSVAPDTLSNRLSGSSWAISSNTWASGTGTAGNAILNTNNISSGTYTLTFSVASGYSMDLSGFSTWMRHSTNGPANCAIAINSTNVATYTNITNATVGVTNSGTITGLTGLTGTVTVTLSLSNAASNGTFRIDNFALYGTVNALPQPLITSLSASDVYSGTTISINGSNFTGANSVTIGGVAVGSFTVVSNTQINATIGTSGASGLVIVGNSANLKDTSATSVTYKGFITNSSTTYTSGGAWLGGVQPPTGSDITIAHVITVSGTNTINVPRNITIANGGSIITAGNAVASNTGTITIEAGGAMTLGSNSTWTSSSSVTNNGTISFNASFISTLKLNAGTFSNNGTLTLGVGNIATAGTVTLTGTTTFNSLTLSGATTLPVGSTINGTLTLNTGGSLVSNSPSYGPSATLVYGKSSTGTGLEWILDATVGTAGAPEHVTVNSGSTLTLNGTGTYYVDGNLSIAGTVTMSGSSLLEVDGNMSGAGTFTHGNRKVTFNGTTQTVSMTTTFYDVDVNASTFTLSGTVTVNRIMNISANTAATLSGSLTIASTSGSPSNLYGSLINTGTISITNSTGFILQNGSTYVHNTTTSVTSIAGVTKNANSTFIYRGSSALATSTSISNRTFGHLRFESTSGTWAPTPNGSTATTINGNLFVGNGVSLTGSTYTGTWTINGNVVVDGIMPSTAPINTVLAGTLDTISGSGTIRFGTLTVNGNYNLLSNMTATATTVSGTLNMNSNVVSGTSFTVASGATIGIGHLQGITLTGNQGNVQTSGTRTYNSNATYLYNGTASQAAGSGLPATVSNLTINNTGIGSNNMVTLSQTTTVTGTLNLMDGHFSATGAVELIVSNTAANAIIGHASMALANNSSYVEGNLRRKVTTGVYDFPLGTSQNYQLATITVNSNTNVDNILVSFDKFATGCGYNGNTPSFYAKPANGSRSTLVDDMLNFGYYTVEPYNSSNVLVTNPNINYDAQMLFNGHNNGVNGYSTVSSSYTLMKKPACGGAWGLYGGSFNTNNNQAQNSNSGAVALKLQSLVSFSQFGAGFSSGTVLPLEMTNFVGEQVNGANQLSWTTLSEESTIKFVIERSENADDFTAIGEVAAKGARNSGADYSFLDEKAGTGIHYYRLKAVDVDGNVSYSEMIALGTKGAISNFNVYPNPAANEIHFAYQLLQANTQATLKVYSMTGALMHAETLNATETNYTLDTHEFKNGLYLYEVLSEGRVLMTGKFDIAR
jgi:hypothetical protein